MSKLSADTSRFLFTAEGTDFLVGSFKAEEHISRMFSVSLELATLDDIDIKTVVDKPGRLTLCSDDEDRFFNGFVYRIAKTGRSGRFHTYKALLSPQAVLLGQRSDCRIFQNQTVPAIVGQVLKTAGITADLFAFRLQDKYPQRDYCVQYRETDLNFIRRLLAEEGIFFYFEHSRDKHLMVFGDSTACYQSIPGGRQIPWNPGGGLTAEQEAVTCFERSHCVLTGKYTQRDFNFEKPALDLTTGHRDKQNVELARFDYPGDYQLPEQGSRLTRVRLQQAALDRDQAGGKSVVARFAPGFTFTLTGAQSDSLDGAYLLTSLKHEGEQPQVLAERSDSDKGTRYLNMFKALPADVTFRPDPGKLIKPAVQGTQTAIVTGPAGEEIYTDRFGRVKVQFHWDRQGKRDENSSCWIWVSQNWAGAGWGAVQIPRIGQEVIVSFLEGDPDRPYVTGRSYHGENLPPYGLPENKTVTTLKTLSSPGGDGFNELRFEDRKNSEQIFMHAEKDLDLRVKNDWRASVGNNTHFLTQKDFFSQINGAFHSIVKADHARQVDGTESVTTGRDFQHQAGGDYGVQTAAQMHLSAGTHVVIDAGNSLTLKAGAGFITIDGSGVSISGPGIKLNSGGSPGSGRGVFTLVPIAPLEAVLALPGRVENNPAVPNRKGSSAAPLSPSPGASAQPQNGTIQGAAPMPMDNLLASFKRKNGSLEKISALHAGYTLSGPATLERPEEKSSRYSTLTCFKTPSGSYTLEFKGFDVKHDKLNA